MLLHLLTSLILLTFVTLSSTSINVQSETKKDIKSIEPKEPKNKPRTKEEIASSIIPKSTINPKTESKLKTLHSEKAKDNTLNTRGNKKQDSRTKSEIVGKSLSGKDDKKTKTGEVQSKTRFGKDVEETKTSRNKHIYDKSKTFDKNRHRRSTTIETSSPTSLTSSAQTTISPTDTSSYTQDGTATKTTRTVETVTDHDTKTMVSTSFVCGECAKTITSTIWEASIVTDRAEYGKIHSHTKYRKSYDYSSHQTIAVADYHMVTCIPAQSSVLEYWYDNKIKTTTLRGIYDNAVIPITHYEGDETVTTTQYVDSSEREINPVTVTQNTWYTDSQGKWNSSPMTVVLMSGQQSEDTCYCPQGLSGYVGVHSNGYYKKERLLEYNSKRWEREEMNSDHQSRNTCNGAEGYECS